MKQEDTKRASDKALRTLENEDGASALRLFLALMEALQEKGAAATRGCNDER